MKLHPSIILERISRVQRGDADTPWVSRSENVYLGHCIACGDPEARMLAWDLGGKLDNIIECLECTATTHGEYSPNLPLKTYARSFRYLEDTARFAVGGRRNFQLVGRVDGEGGVRYYSLVYDDHPSVGLRAPFHALVALNLEAEVWRDREAADIAEEAIRGPFAE